MKKVIVIAILACTSVPLYAAENANIVRWAEGTIEYRKISTGEVTGSEEFHVTVHPDGSRTMDTRNRMENKQRQRRITMRVAKDFRPLELTADFWTAGEWRGTGLIAVDGNELQAVIKTPNGFITQRRAVPDHFSFIPHPLSTDAWNSWYYDKAKGGAQKITVYDLDPDAAPVSSFLGKMYDSTITFKGIKKVTTPAGTFETEHFQFQDGVVDFYLAGPDRIMVKFVWGPDDSEYVLTSYKEGK